MSQEELVASYQSGELSRRTFIRRLVAGGVSLGAAASYAHLLAPGAQAADGTDFYEIDAVRVRSESRRQILKENKVRVRMAISGPATVQVFVTRRRAGRMQTVARRTGRFPAGSTVVSVPLTQGGREILRNSGAVRLTVEARAAFPGGDRETLKTSRLVA